MLVFLDDSGDLGFKVKKGSSPCFVIALVIFDDHLEGEACAVEIRKLRRELGLSEHFEVKFSKCCERFRMAFLTRIAPFKFRIRALVWGILQGWGENRSDHAHADNRCLPGSSQYVSSHVLRMTPSNDPPPVGTSASARPAETEGAGVMRYERFRWFRGFLL